MSDTPDSSLDILIRTLADTNGIEAVQQSISKLKDEVKKDTAATGENAEATEKAVVSKTELRRVAGHLSREFPLLGAAVRIFLNPLVAGLTLAILAFGKLREQIKETLTLLEPSVWEGRAAAINAGTQAFEKAAIAAAAFNQELSRGESATDAIRQNTKATVDAIHAQATAEAEKRNASKALELARVDMAEKSGQLSPDAAIMQRLGIENRYAQAESRAKLLADNKELNAHLAERVGLLNRIDEIQAALPAMQEKAAEAESRMAVQEEDRKILAQNIAASKKKVQDYDEELEKRSKFGMRSGIYDALTDDYVRSSRQSEIDEMNKAQGALNKLSGERVASTIADKTAIADAERAQQELIEAHHQLPGMDRDIDERVSQYQLGIRSRAEVGQMETLTRTYKAAGDIGGDANRLQEEILNNIQAGRGVTGEMVRALQEDTIWKNAIKEQLRQQQRSHPRSIQCRADDRHGPLSAGRRKQADRESGRRFAAGWSRAFRSAMGP